jgi:hypothetical protein
LHKKLRNEFRRERDGAKACDGEHGVYTLRKLR